MIYSPGKFLFVHIPRAAGSSITAALAARTVGRDDVLIATGIPIADKVSLRRHSRGLELASILPDFNDIYKFAVYRNPAEILDSQAKAMLLARKSGELDVPGGIKYKSLLKNRDIREFNQSKWDGTSDPWTHWCCDEEGNELGFDRIPFETLTDHWASVCNNCNIPFKPLPHVQV